MNNTDLKFNSTSLERNHKFESDAMICSGIELLIRNHAYDSGLCKYLPEIGFLLTGEIIFCNGQIEMLPNQPFLINQHDIPAAPFNIQPGCEPTFIACLGVSKIIINDYLRFRGKFTMLRAFDMMNRINQIQPVYIPQNTQASSWDMRDIQVASELGVRFGFTGNWNLSCSQNGAWVKSPPPQQACLESSSEIIHINNASGIYVYSLQIFDLNNREYAVLPIAYFQNSYYRTSLKLFIPPAPLHTWVYSESLAIYPNSTVILTKDILIAKINPPSDDFVFLCNPGGNEWINQIDIQPLAGRKIICLIENDSRAELQYSAHVANRLASYNITPLFALTDHEQNDNGFLINSTMAETNAKIVGISTFIKKAQQAGAVIPETIHLTRNGAIDIEGTHKSFPLLENIINQGEITYIHEHKKVDRNIISSRLLSALLNHTKPFSSHCNNLAKNKIRSIVFIDIENRKRYIDLLNKADVKTHENNYSLLFETSFLRQAIDDGIKMFRNIVNTDYAKAVIFDSDSIWSGTRNNVQLLKDVIRYCISENIAVVMIFHNQKDINNFIQCNRLINVWKYGERLHNHVVEIDSLSNHDIKPFEFFLEDNNWISKSFLEEKLSDIPERSHRDNKPGVSPSFNNAIQNLPKDELLGIKKSDNIDNGKNNHSSYEKQ